MIRGLHGLFYSSEPDALRAFLRDKLRLAHSDVGEGWLIFDLPEADLGVHPTDPRGGPPSGTHDLSFYCDDIQGTVADLRARGVEFTQEIADHGYGFVTYFTMPGGMKVQLYEPRYTKGSSRSKPKAKAAKKAPAKKAPAKKAPAKKAPAKTSKAKPAAGKRPQARRR